MGEYLIAEHIITPAQLEAALEEQIHLRLAGHQLALGNLLIRKKYLTPKLLQKVLDDQRKAFYAQMAIRRAWGSRLEIEAGVQGRWPCTPAVHVRNNVDQTLSIRALRRSVS